MINLFFVSLGCDKNLVDTERMLGVLDPGRYRVTNDEYEADVIVINTCCFIDEAKEESIETILDMARCKDEGRCRALIVAGCMAERYREEVTKEIPEVDAVLGTGSFVKIEAAIEKALAGEQSAFFDLPENAWKETEGVSYQKRTITTGGRYEYLKIAEGCNKHCTYCVIPKLRGSYRSIPMERLLKEAQDLADAGVRELILIAEETTSYGVDLYGKKSLHILLEKLCAIEELHWIRILYCYPEEIYPEMVTVMKQEPKVLHYLDLPIQHASDEILRRMGRRTNRKQLEETVGMLRKELPDVVLRTTLISGFPGETEEHHQDVMEFVRKMRFDRLGVFAYSQEEGTPAAAMPDQIPDEVKQARRDEILALQQSISLENGKRKIGRELEVQIDGYLAADEVYAGRTYADAPDVDGYCFVKSDEVLDTGMFVRVRITGATEYDLAGEMTEQED